ncbi:PREDICTED: endogenous retrovirus group K member 6 Pol protein-like, partial [Mesitornis unicolor]|uniref:endogenous retrovirus group K member 6 Pol protein-like n=1 Tax=Mesitornis unicolor TaxID=54374 RepID=UPI0005285B61
MAPGTCACCSNWYRRHAGSFAKCTNTDGGGTRKSYCCIETLCFASSLHTVGKRLVKSVEYDTHHNFTKFSVRVADLKAQLRLMWLTTNPVWVDQWPLKGEKLSKAEELVTEQLQLGHIVPSTSPWNTIFVIPKKSGKWRLLQDLRMINAVMQPMGPLQPGVPNPTLILADLPLYIIDLKDCFFTFPLHPDDCHHSAFSVLSANNQAPVKRYEWAVFPQGMTNSPTVCQLVVATAVEPTRCAYPQAHIYHSMDDILLAAEQQADVLAAMNHLWNSSDIYGLQVAPDKIQSEPPWKYLGWTLLERIIVPQNHKLLHSSPNLELQPEAIVSPVPLQGGKTIFIDGSGKTGKAAVVWQDVVDWKASVITVEGSVQEVRNQKLFQLFIDIAVEIRNRKHNIFIMHIHSHTSLPGPITEGNRRADALTVPIFQTQRFERARISHSFFHQNATSLQKEFSITKSQAHDIVRACAGCQQYVILPTTEGVNVRGLAPDEIWQTDVAHHNSFGKMKYIHVTVDSFSGYIIALAAAGEKSKDVRRHWLRCFAILGVPKQIKTDNGPAYIAQATALFLQQWNVKHVTGIPHSPTGQATIERAHQNLKHMQLKQERGNSPSPQEQLDNATYTLSFLNPSSQHLHTAATERHFQGTPHFQHGPKVWYRDLPGPSIWKGPVELITLRRGPASQHRVILGENLRSPDRRALSKTPGK